MGVEIDFLTKFEIKYLNKESMCKTQSIKDKIWIN